MVVIDRRTNADPYSYALTLIPALIVVDYRPTSTNDRYEAESQLLSALGSRYSSPDRLP
jgi:hypothetical protein